MFDGSHDEGMDNGTSQTTIWSFIWFYMKARVMRKRDGLSVILTLEGRLREETLVASI